MSVKSGSVDIICPLRNAEVYLEKLHSSFLMQEGVKIRQIRYVVTKGDDETEEIVSRLAGKGLADGKVAKAEKHNERTEGIETVFRVITPKEFSHSKTREEEVFASKADVVVFVTQDVVIRRKDWLRKLVQPIFDGGAEATYSRQICNPEIEKKFGKKGSIEKYTREANYLSESFTVSKDDIERLGLKAFFFSDASGAILREKFVKLSGYDGKKLLINEDMYFAHKLIMDGGRIRYCADSVVEHSHNFSLRELYRRYKLTGKFMKTNPKIAKAGVSGAGGSLAKYIFRRAWEEKNWGVLVRFLPDMGARWLGMKVGER